MQINFENNNKAGLVVWGTKVGLKCFFTGNIIETVEVKKEPFRDADSEFENLSQIRTAENPSYLITRMPGYTCITGYWGALDDVGRHGFLGISLLIPAGKLMKGQAVAKLINSLSKLYWDNYISKSPNGNAIKNYFVEDPTPFIYQLTDNEYNLTPTSRISTSTAANRVLFRYRNEDDIADVINDLYEDEYLNFRQIFMLQLGSNTTLRSSLPEIPIPKIDKKINLTLLFTHEKQKINNYRITIKRNGEVIINDQLNKEEKLKISKLRVSENIELFDKLSISFSKDGFKSFTITENDLQTVISNSNQTSSGEVSLNIPVSRIIVEAAEVSPNKESEQTIGGNSSTFEWNYQKSKENLAYDAGKSNEIILTFVDDKSGNTLNNVTVIVNRDGREQVVRLEQKKFNLRVYPTEPISLIVKSKFYKPVTVDNYQVKGRIENNQPIRLQKKNMLFFIAIPVVLLLGAIAAFFLYPRTSTIDQTYITNQLDSAYRNFEAAKDDTTKIKLAKTEFDDLLSANATVLEPISLSKYRTDSLEINTKLESLRENATKISKEKLLEEQKKKEKIKQDSLNKIADQKKEKKDVIKDGKKDVVKKEVKKENNKSGNNTNTVPANTQKSDSAPTSAISDEQSLIASYESKINRATKEKTLITLRDEINKAVSKNKLSDNNGASLLIKISTKIETLKKN